MMTNSLEKEYLSELEMLEVRFDKIFERKVFPEEFPYLKGKGSYVLVVYLPFPIRIRGWNFLKGVYLYVGSALKGYKNRLKRYIEHINRKHWHIDYLLDYAKVVCAYLSSCEEKEIAKRLSLWFNGIKGFGNSDDPYCDSHLFYIFPLHFIVENMYLVGKEKGAPVYKGLSFTKDPFLRFIFAFLSSRTKDEITLEVVKRFSEKFSNWEDIRSSSIDEIEKVLYGVAFHKIKAKNLKKISYLLVDRKVPSNYDELVSLPGIGRKIAKVILADAFNKPYVAVDTHVHRISNRIGIIDTKDKEESDNILNIILPEDLKVKYNISLVGYGQTICLPRNPRCNECKIKEFCKYYMNNIGFRGS